MGRKDDNFENVIWVGNGQRRTALTARPKFLSQMAHCKMCGDVMFGIYAQARRDFCWNCEMENKE